MHMKTGDFGFPGYTMCSEYDKIKQSYIEIYTSSSHCTCMDGISTALGEFGLNIFFVF